VAADAAGPAGSVGRWWLRFGLGPLLLRWWRRRGLRARVTIIAAIGLIAAFIAIDLLLFNALRVSLTRSVDDTARSGAAEVASLFDTGRLPDPVLAGDITIQVLSPNGRVFDVSADADRLVPIVPPAQARALARGGGALLLQGAPFDMPAALRVVVVPADKGYLVIAAVPFSETSGSLNVVARALVFVTPLLFIAFTGAIWLVTGSTLRPIAALRRGAARVTVTGVPADLPVPEARDEVRLLALTLNTMLSQLAGAQQRQRALVSDTAHELRSPIASIRTQLEVALDFPESQDWATTARDVHADVLRLARLTEDLLLLARLDEQAGLAASSRPTANGAGPNGSGPNGAGPNGAGPNGSGPNGAGPNGAGPNGAGTASGARAVFGELAQRGPLVDLDALSRSVACRYADARVPVTVAALEAGAAAARRASEVASAQAAASGTAGPAGAAGGTARECDAVLVNGSPEGLERLLVNLVDNAVRYAKSAVTVAVRRDGAWAELSVTDDGPGIPAADRERAFGRFTRLDDARSRDGDEAGGAGLGLAIVRATAQAHGGTAFLEVPGPESPRADPSADPARGQAQAAAPGPGLRAVVRLPAAGRPA
jgi:signal transduction histidine kinase